MSAENNGREWNPGPVPEVGDMVDVIAPAGGWIVARVSEVRDVDGGHIVAMSGNGGDGPHISGWWGSRCMKRRDAPGDRL